MRTVIKDVESGWRKATSEGPQGAVLVPVYASACSVLCMINDMIRDIYGYMSVLEMMPRS